MYVSFKFDRFIYRFFRFCFGKKIKILVRLGNKFFEFIEYIEM